MAVRIFTILFVKYRSLPITRPSDSGNYLRRVVLRLVDLFVLLEFTKATSKFSQPKPSPSESKLNVSGFSTVKFLYGMSVQVKLAEYVVTQKSGYEGSQGLVMLPADPFSCI